MRQRGAGEEQGQLPVGGQDVMMKGSYLKIRRRNIQKEGMANAKPRENGFAYFVSQLPIALT